MSIVDSPYRVKRGRPRSSYLVVLQADGGKTILQRASIRSQVLTALREAGGSMRMPALVERFGVQVKGAVQKLFEAGHVRKQQT